MLVPVLLATIVTVAPIGSTCPRLSEKRSVELFSLAKVMAAGAAPMASVLRIGAMTVVLTLATEVSKVMLVGFPVKVVLVGSGV